jgi:signal transduction histidine kinase
MFVCQNEEVDLQENLHLLILRNRDKTELKNQNIVFSPCAERPFILTDKHIFEEIVENLLDNAVKYSRHGSDIFIGLEAAANNAVISVCDQGPGFSRSDREKIFTPFASLTAKPTGGENSTGLGLYVAYNLARKLGGNLQLNPDYSDGACIEVILPLHRIRGSESCGEEWER